jgi:outer membrane lipoprotein-sorting protein
VQPCKSSEEAMMLIPSLSAGLRRLRAVWWRSSRRLLISLVALILCGGGAAPLPDAAEIVRQHVEAIGGARWQNVQSLVVKGSGSYAAFTWAWKRPGKFRTEERDETYSGKTLVTGFDGVVGWTSNPLLGPATPRRLTPTEMQRWLSGVIVRSDLLDLPAKGADLTLLGQENVNSRMAYKLSLNRPGRDTVLLWIDTQSYLLVQRGRKVKPPWGGAETLRVTPLSDYRSVQGLLIPHRVGDTRCLVQVNPDLGDSLFAPPPELR